MVGWEITGKRTLPTSTTRESAISMKIKKTLSIRNATGEMALRASDPSPVALNVQSRAGVVSLPLRPPRHSEALLPLLACD